MSFDKNELTNFVNDFTSFLTTSSIDICRSKSKSFVMKEEWEYLSSIFGMIIYTLYKDIPVDEIISSMREEKSFKLSKDFSSLYIVIKEKYKERYIKGCLDELTYATEMFIEDEEMGLPTLNYSCFESYVRDLLKKL